MDYISAIKTNKFVKRKKWDFQSFCYFLPNTGPYKDLVSCDYFCFLEDGYLSMSTSAPDLYAEDIFADDYEISNITEQEIQSAYSKSQNISS